MGCWTAQADGDGEQSRPRLPAYVLIALGIAVVAVTVAILAVLVAST
jgi:hypothetical protein